jgi:outer membrane protein
LKTASLSVDKSKWGVAAAKTRRFPATKTYLFASGNLDSPAFTFKQGIFGTANGLPNGPPIPSRNMNIDLSQGVAGYALAELAQPITQLYKINLAIHQQQLATDFASQEYRAKRQSVVADVKQAYYAVLQSESALGAAQAAVKQYEETYRVAQQYVAQEAVLNSESLEVKAKLAQSKYQVVQVKDELQTRKENLNNLLARDLDTDFRTEAVPPPSADETNLKMAQQTALAQRPEIAEAQINVKKADYDRKIAKSQYIPDIGAAVHYFSPINTEILPQNIVSAGIELSWEPFDWGRRKDDIKQKEISIDQSQYQLKDAQSQVLLDVNNRFRKLEESRALLEVADAARDAANEKLREVTDKFGKEAVLLRDVLQQQATVAKANDDYAQALLTFWTAKANFDKALGEE